MKIPNQQNSLLVTTLFETPNGDCESNRCYREVLLCTLKKILPKEFFDQLSPEEATHEHQRMILNKLLPLITCSDTRHFPGNLSFFALSKYRPNSFKFFFEMLSRWLIPGRRLNVVLVYASDFRLTEVSGDLYTICEVMISIENAAEFEEIQRHFPFISAEIVLGIDSAFYAQRILEIKGLSADDKTALIQSFIAFLVKRFPHAYDYDVFTEMQHVLVTCRDEFKAARQPRHLSRIISVQYLFRKALREAIKKKPNKRHLSLKIFRAFIQTPLGKRRVLGLLVGVNFLRDQETFGEKHLLKAIQHHIPIIQAVEQSFFMNKFASENIYTFYLEVEKNDRTEFTEIEIKKLRRELPADLKNRIEHKQHPIFMPRNEEEVMRNILILSNQIRYLRDIPQVFISFDEQSHSHLFFTVILARVVKLDTRPIPELFRKANTFLEYIHDRTKLMGYIRKKYIKEAVVFRLKVPKEDFLRADHSIDLYKARQTVVNELSRIVGEIRDYNGGMISKQHELLSHVRALLVDKEHDEFLLENFFYSLAPVVVRALVDPKAFRTLFLLLVEGLKEYKQEGYLFKKIVESYNVFAIVICEDSIVKNLLNQAIYEIDIPSTELAYAYIKINGSACIGYICCAKDPTKKEQLFRTIEELLEARYVQSSKI